MAAWLSCGFGWCFKFLCLFRWVSIGRVVLYYDCGLCDLAFGYVLWCDCLIIWCLHFTELWLL